PTPTRWHPPSSAPSRSSRCSCCSSATSSRASPGPASRADRPPRSTDHPPVCGGLVLNASLTIDPGFIVAPVNRRTFGSFVEHMGRCVYTGIYEPDHPTADADGFRQDVLALTRELGVSIVRYPGGTFVSRYR